MTKPNARRRRYTGPEVEEGTAILGSVLAALDATGPNEAALRRRIEGAAIGAKVAAGIPAHSAKSTTKTLPPGPISTPFSG